MTTRPDPKVTALANRLHAAGASRRTVLRSALALAAAAFIPGALAQAPAVRVRFRGEPFTLGVASGYPRADGVSLWTRLAPRPFEPEGGMPGIRPVVEWEVAEDEAFGRIAKRGRHTAAPELAYSVHVDVDGLSPDRWYFYRFRSGDAVRWVDEDDPRQGLRFDGRLAALPQGHELLTALQAAATEIIAPAKPTRSSASRTGCSSCARGGSRPSWRR